MFSLYNGALNLPHKEQIMVIEGLAYVASDLSIEAATNAMKAMLKPHFDQLTAFVTSASSVPASEFTLVSSQADLVCNLLDRMSTVIMHCRPRMSSSIVDAPGFVHPLMSILIEILWNVLHQTGMLCMVRFVRVTR